MTRLCALYGVTRAGYYAWRARPSSAHAAQDRQLQQHIHRLFQQHHGAYGSPRLQRALRAEGWAVSRRRVARLMRAAGLRARVAQLYRANPRLHRFFGQHPNRLWARVARRPNQIWVGDITYVPVVGRWRFLAVVLDQCSRRVLAWALARTRDAHLTRTVLDAAVRRRRPRPGLIFHSDRGSEYAARAFRDRLRVLGIRQSATRGATPGDKADPRRAVRDGGPAAPRAPALRVVLQSPAPAFGAALSGAGGLRVASCITRGVNETEGRSRAVIALGEAGCCAPGGARTVGHYSCAGGRVARSLSAIR